MSKIFRESETQEIETFLSEHDRVTPEFKIKIQEELKAKKNYYKDCFIWLISRREDLTIDVFNVKGEVFETNTYPFEP